MPEIAVFALFAFLALVSAVVVVAHRNPVYSVVSLVVTLFSLAVLFVLLGAPYVATLQVLIYTGAILVLFLFVLMLLNLGRERAGTGGRGQAGVALLASLALGGVLLPLFAALPAARQALSAEPSGVALAPLARILFRHYLLPFEIIGLLLLAAVVAATVLARRAPAAGEEPR